MAFFEGELADVQLAVVHCFASLVSCGGVLATWGCRGWRLREWPQRSSDGAVDVFGLCFGRRRIDTGEGG